MWQRQSEIPSDRESVLYDVCGIVVKYISRQRADGKREEWRIIHLCIDRYKMHKKIQGDNFLDGKINESFFPRKLSDNFPANMYT